MDKSKVNRGLSVRGPVAPTSANCGRSYPPDYVSAETLAYRLDCSKSTVHAYVRSGLLPKPLKIGELVRWRWTDVKRFIEELEQGTYLGADVADPYLQGVEDAATKKTLH
jgi:predicted DNA-binding transcriptional regulator AlpA